MDRLSEFAYSISPYRFAYNNPVYYNDPTGLYENGLSGWVNTGAEVFWDPNVNNQSDVDRLYNGQNYNYLLDDTVILDSDGDKRQLNGDGTVTTILDEVVVSGSNKNKSSNSFSIVEGFSIWGSNRYGDLGGQKGSAQYSIEASDIPAIGGTANSVRGQMSFWNRLFMLCKLGVDVESRAETIQSLNQSTMEVNNTEPVLPPVQSVATISIPKVTFDASGNGSRSATKFNKDTIVNKKDSARVTNEAKNIQQNDIKNFNKKYGTDF